MAKKKKSRSTALMGLKAKNVGEKVIRPAGGILLGAAIAEGASTGALMAFPSLSRNMTPVKEAAITASSGSVVVLGVNGLLSRFVLKGNAKAMASKVAKAALVGVVVKALLPLMVKSTNYVATFVAKTVARAGGKALPAASSAPAAVIDMTTRTQLPQSSTEAKVAARNAERARQIGGPTLRPMGGTTLRPR